MATVSRYAESLRDGMIRMRPTPSVPEQGIQRPLRILMVASEAPPVRGGIARIVGSLRDGLQSYGHHVDVLAYPEVRRLVFGEVRLSSLVFKLPYLFRRLSEYDVLHVHGITPTVSDVALLLARFFRSRPCIVYTHHVDLDLRQAGVLNRVYNCLHHQLIRGTDMVIAATRDTLNLSGRNSSRGFVIPFGIDLAHFSANTDKDQQFTVLFLGQFRPWKGVDVLLRAVSQVPSTKLLLAGHGPEEQIYRSQAARLGLDVEFHIAVRDEQLRQLYQRASIVVTPSVSRLEAFGLALLEGMAAGCVPVASDLPGVREVAGRVGFLFPPGDVNRLAAILQELRDHPEQVRRIGQQARLYAANYTQENMVCAYERLFSQLVALRYTRNQLSYQVS